MVNYITGNVEIVKVAEAVAAEKGISKDSVIDAIEQAIKIAAKKKYGNEYLIDVKIDRKTGGFKIFRSLLIVEEVQDPNIEISLETVKKSSDNSSDAKIGEYVQHTLPPINLGRLVAQVVKQVIVNKIRLAETEKNYEIFKDKVGEIITGVVKKVGPKGILFDISGVEAYLDKDDSIPNEIFKQNDRVRALVKDIQKKETGLQIYLTRTSGDFLSKLFMQEVPEIYDGIIQIKAIAREAGERSKIAVSAVESNLDPVGACVGVRGSRVQVIINELKGEKIDVIEWSPDSAKFVVNALVPARVLKVVIDEERSVIEAVVSDSDYSLAIGRKGQNARLASKISGWNIDILTEENEQKIRKEENQKIYSIFADELQINEMHARVLMAEGFSNVEELLLVSAEELSSFEGFTEEDSVNIQSRAQKFINTDEYKQGRFENLGLDERFSKIKTISIDLGVLLSSKKIKKLELLADLSRDELHEIIGEEINVSNKDLDEIIMEARKIAYQI